MPNHLHGIIIIDNEDANTGVETGFKPVSAKPACTAKRYSLSEIVRGFKTFTSKRINEFQKTQGRALWQSSFYDRIIRDDKELMTAREYILNNPERWALDRDNPEYNVTT